MASIRLNKYIGDTGFCSRREADQLITDERVTVNGVLAQMGQRVELTDKVRVDGETLKYVNLAEEARKLKEERDALRGIAPKSETEKREKKHPITRGTRGGERTKVKRTHKPRTTAANNEGDAKTPFKRTEGKPKRGSK